jgi:hypothetical protein
MNERKGASPHYSSDSKNQDMSGGHFQSHNQSHHSKAAILEVPKHNRELGQRAAMEENTPPETYDTKAESPKNEKKVAKKKPKTQQNPKEKAQGTEPSPHTSEDAQSQTQLA